MIVYKFGGASVRDADGVRNLAGIVSGESDRLFVIISAMGKVTNALEKLLVSFYESRPGEARERLSKVIAYHDTIISDLWEGAAGPESVGVFYRELEDLIGENPLEQEYESWYDRIVGYGELISTAIVSEYLNHTGINNEWVDMRKYFVTTSRHMDANIEIDTSERRLRELVSTSPSRVFIGQGFIGATEDGVPTTVGREGSDYSAAVAGHILEAQSVAIWKDVEGILNGDPKFFPEAEHIPELSYLDAIELAYSGAQILHPKTIKPLQNKNIPLHVRSFIHHDKPGSIIGGTEQTVDKPIFILKRDQVLLTIRPRDFSFVLEERFAQIFALFEEFHAKVNLIQSSAVSLSTCIDNTRRLDEIITRLDGDGFSTAYNTDMELLTIRGYTPQQQEAYGESADVYMSQRTRRSLRIVRKANG